MDTFEELGSCGIFCANCGNYKKNENCQGCRNETELLEDCPTRICAINKGILFCGQCADFPCSILSDFYFDGKPSHKQAYQNMLEINEIGAAAWLLRQQEEQVDKE